VLGPTLYAHARQRGHARAIGVLARARFDPPKADGRPGRPPESAVQALRRRGMLGLAPLRIHPTGEEPADPVGEPVTGCGDQEVHESRSQPIRPCSAPPTPKPAAQQATRYDLVGVKRTRRPVASSSPAVPGAVHSVLAVPDS